jgi:chorismate synthase
MKFCFGRSLSSFVIPAGRVAAGAIAERYLKLAYGVEIVAFVSSVGKVHMPESSTDSDLLSEDYLKLLHGLTREKVDENMIRCPHQETADAMEEVSFLDIFLSKSRTFCISSSELTLN